MTTEFQPRERLPFYLPENWLPIDFDTAAGSGSFINYPTAQTANISFPGTILCSNLQSFAPSAAMNLFNNSTSGNIQIANANTFTGGIVINANATTPVANETIIGTSARALVAPLFRTSEIYGTGAFAGQVDVKADLQVANGYGLYSNFLEQYTGGILTVGGVNGSRIDIGTGAGRTDDINIGSNMTGGNILLGGASTTVKANIIQSDSTLVIQQSDNVGAGAVQIGCGITRTGNIEIGANTNAAVGSTGNVNIMNGTGRQEGSFNVLTNSNNRGVINLGNTGALEGGIHIYAELKSSLKIGYTALVGDAYIGAYKTGVYNSVTSMTLNTTQQRIVGSLTATLSVGLYQININTTLSSSVLNPYLTYAVYTKSGLPAWTNGGLRGTLGTVENALTVVRRSPTTATSDIFTLSVSGILLLSTKNYLAIVVGNADATVSQNITFTDTYISAIRIG